MAELRVIAGLLHGWSSQPFEHFRDGVEVCYLWQGGPDVAL